MAIPEEAERMEETQCTKRVQRKEATLSHLGLGAVVCWCLVLLPCVTSQVMQERFLNSQANCGHKDYKPYWDSVDQQSLYNVRDDVSPDTRTGTVINGCQMVFRSVSSDGRLCIYQRNLQIDSDDIELRLYDGQTGVDGKDAPDVVVNREKYMMGREWCTNGRYLTIEMKPRNPQASVKFVTIDLLVYHMTSVHRKAFLDTIPSCGSTFKLDHSQVNVTNVDKNHNSPIYVECSLNFVYSGSDHNRTLCMVFEPLQGLSASQGSAGDADADADAGGGGGDGGGGDAAAVQKEAGCGMEYKLTVEEKGKGAHQLESITIGCTKPLSKKWCFNTTKIRLTLMRSGGQVFAGEDVLFHALVLDHEGGPSTLPSMFKESEVAESAPFSTIIVVCITFSILLFVILILIMVWVMKRRRHSANRSPKKTNDNASSHMMDPEQRCNGQNEYAS